MALLQRPLQLLVLWVLTWTKPWVLGFLIIRTREIPPISRTISSGMQQFAHNHEPSRTTTSTATSTTQLTDWVIENLENESSSITSSSPIQAGENDTLPATGLVIGDKIRILAADSASLSDDNDALVPIRLLVGRNGWGTGVHPTTRLCLEWMCDNIEPGQVVLDYGCGSGILSIAALKAMSASQCIGVDIEAEALVTAARNVALNELSEERFEGLHTREVLPYSMIPPVDVCVANILVGPLVRPSMVAAIVTNLADGGLLCLSGIRPNQVDSVKTAYSTYVEWMDGQYAELSADQTPGSIESYGFDCGTWARLVGRKKTSSTDNDIERMSEMAVS